VQNPAFLQFPGTKNDPTETQISRATSQLLNINFEK
jgi:hypothetical protein